MAAWPLFNILGEIASTGTDNETQSIGPLTEFDVSEDLNVKNMEYDTCVFIVSMAYVTVLTSAQLGRFLRPGRDTWWPVHQCETLQFQQSLRCPG
jgi:hypothetical protein